MYVPQGSVATSQPGMRNQSHVGFLRQIARISFLLVCLAGTNNVMAQCIGPVFPTVEDFVAGPQSSGVTSADFNNDNIVDLAVSNLTGSSVSILLGDGVGGFGPPTNLAVRESPRGIASGDFNEDGKADLVVGHFSGGGPVSVLFGNGTGLFSAPVIINIGGNHQSLAVADFNADGNLDVAVATIQGNPSIMLGDGAGNFSIQQITVGNDSTDVAVADFNGDGLSDMAFTTNSIPSKVTIFLGNPAGTFVPWGIVPLDQSPKAITARDFNGDGHADIAVAVEHFEPRLMIFLSTGLGGFTTISFVVNYYPDSVVSGDFNGDGKMDIALLIVSGGGVQVFLGNGVGGFTTGPHRFLTGLSPRQIYAGDVNSDGKLDLISANAFSLSDRQQGSISVLLGDGTGVFETSRSYWDSSLQPRAIAVGDFNNNGRSDLAVTVAFSSQIVIRLDDGAGGLLPPVTVQAQSDPVSLALGDFDGDSKLDLASANEFGGTVSIFTGNGSGGFAPPIHVAVGAEPTAIVSGNFNADNRTDLAVRLGSGHVAILLSNNTGGFDPGPGSPFDAGARTIVAGDYNNDGRADIAAAKTQDNTVTILLNNGAGFLTLMSTTPVPVSNFFEMRLAAHDLNHDGNTDLISANAQERNLTVFLGNGGGGLAPGVNFDLGLHPSAGLDDLAVADFDGDNNPDVAVSTAEGFFASGSLTIAFGDGSGSFAALQRYPAGATPNSLGVGDFNADLKPDLAVTNTFGRSISVLMNSSVSLPCLSVNDATLTEGNGGTTNADFTVSLSAASAQTVRVNFSLSGTSATSPADFAPLSGRLAFAPGELTKTISIPITGDALDEADETFIILLANPSNAAIGDGEGLGTILDDDPTPTLSVNNITVTEPGFLTWNFTVTLSAVSGRAVTVQYATAEGTATGGTFTVIGDFLPTSGTLTIPAGQASATIGVLVLNDDRFEPQENFFLNLSNPTNATIEDGQGEATILNDDPVPTVTLDLALITEGNVGTQNASINVRLSNPTFQTVSLDFATVNDSATAPSDYTATSGMLTFNPDEVEKTVSVPVHGDTVDEVTERLFLDVSNVQNASVSGARGEVLIIDDDGPSISINDVNITEGNSGTSSATFTLTLSSVSVENVRVRAITQIATATAPADYSSLNLNVTFPAGTLTRTLNVPIVGDTVIEPDETFFVNLSLPLAGTIADAQGVGTITNDDATLQFNSTQLSVGENNNRADLRVTRLGATSSELSVDYATSDTAALTNCNVVNGIASSRCDYATSVGRLSFAAGESIKTISIPIVDDAYAEGNESFTITLGNATGAPLGSPASATVTINDNDTSNGTNPIDQTAFFVRQHYIDFLSREPDPAGAAGWEAVINNCPAGDTTCDRIHVSSSFFRSPEFQGRGYFVYRFYPVAFGRKPEYVEFIPDLAKVSGFLSDAQLEAAKLAFIAEFMSRPPFVTKFDGLNNTQYVDALLATAGITHIARDFWIAALGSGTRTRAEVLREIAESNEVYNKYYNQAFVVMQYFGYLRRDPDALYLDWIQVLDTTGDFRGMVNGFMNSAEYRLRFGP